MASARFATRQPSERRARAGAAHGCADSCGAQNSGDAPEFDFIAPEGPNQVVQALGMTVVIPTAALRKEFKLADQRGVVVTSSAGAVRDKGVRRGDLVTDVNGKPIADPAAFFAAVRAVPAKGQVRVTYWRDGKTHTIEVPADVPPAKPGRREGSWPD